MGNMWISVPESIAISTGKAKQALHKQATIHQVTIMLATSRNVLFPGHNHLPTTGTDESSLTGTGVIIIVSGLQHWWLAGG